MTGRTAPRPLVVVGDALLDRDVTGRADRLSPDAPVPVVSAVTEAERPGGAALAALLAALDRPAGGVVLVTALGADPAGERVAELLAAAGVTVVAGRLAGRTPEKERVRVAGQSLLRLDRDDGPAAPAEGTPAMRAALAGAGAVLVSDYGRGLVAGAELRGWLAGAAAPAAGGVGPAPARRGAGARGAAGHPQPGRGGRLRRHGGRLGSRRRGDRWPRGPAGSWPGAGGPAGSR